MKSDLPISSDALGCEKRIYTGSIDLRFIYLRNKETQQTLRVNVSIQYDASF